MLRVDEFAIHVDVEDATGAFDEKGFRTESHFEFGSQTGRLGFIVSLHAISDRYVHNLAFVDRR